MQDTHIRKDEWAGFGVAVLLHAALLAVLLVKPDVPEALPKPEAITVSLAEDVGLQSSAPVPVPESRASMGPVLSDVPAPTISQDVPLSRADPVQPAARMPIRRTEPTREQVSRRVRTQRETTRRDSKPETSERRSEPKQSASAASSRSGGASKEFSQAFDGAGSRATSNDTRDPASAISGAAKASLLQSVVRQLRPHWKPPEGADAEQLFTMVSFRLNENGSLSGTPQCKPTQGVTPSNQAQANIHCREAIRAIRGAAPFNLPDRFYNAWKSVNDFKFGATL